MSLSGFAWSRQGRHCASWPRSIRPARSSTLRCLDTAGRLMSKGSASFRTEDSPEARRARIARRVGSARAAKVLLRRSGDMFLITPFMYLTYRLNINRRLVKRALRPGCAYRNCERVMRSKDETDADQVPSVVRRILADPKLPSMRMMPVLDEDPARQVVSERDIEIPVRAVEIVHLVDPDCADPGSPLRVSPHVVDAGKEICLARLDMRLAHPESEPRSPPAAVARGNEHGTARMDEVVGHGQPQIRPGFVERVRRRTEENQHAEEKAGKRRTARSDGRP